MLPMLSRKTDRFPLFGLRGEIDRLFEDFLDGNGQGSLPATVFAPTLDMKEGDKGIVIEVELPGMKSSEIDVQVVDGTLVLRGERKQEKEEKTKQWHRAERSWGRFERRIALPDHIDAEKIEASCKDGVLSITMPRRPEVKPKAISISVK